jgi:hypothetical protein
MVKYQVIKDFADLEDNRYTYHVGDKYPHKGRVKKERIDELLGTENKLGLAVIKELDEGDE